MGFKAYNLWRMARLSMPVPPAFVLGTGFCRAYFASHRKPPPGLRAQLAAHIQDLEEATGLRFGSERKPLLVSVRSGAPVSMPGMMETILDVGMNDTTVRGILRLTGNPRLAWDSYRRLVQSFAEVVVGCPADAFEQALSRRLQASGVASARELDFQSLQALTRDYLELFEAAAEKPFPQDPLDQLEAAVTGVWSSWAGDKAVAYRRLNGLPDELGTAVTVQRMVYGNAGGTSGAGVAFTRDPATGERSLYLDFMFNAQGEDVVSGRHRISDASRLSELLPTVYGEILKAGQLLEQEFRDMQEFEFTVQDGMLSILQTRAGKRTSWAALRIIVEQAEEGLIATKEALDRAAALDLGGIGRSRIVRANETRTLCRAVSASIGVAVGEIAFDAAKARDVAAAGRAAILVREDIATDDIVGIASAAGILTATGGRTAHAAVVARQLNKVCLVGCEALTVDLASRRCSIGGQWFSEGDSLCLDGHSGEVLAGAVQIETERPAELLAKLAHWRAVPAAA
jgi:pyruvate,orthophosphate dikinase